MLAPSGSSTTSPIRSYQSAYHVPSGENGRSEPPLAPRASYDSFTASSAEASAADPQRDIVSRIAREVRTATTTGDIQALREQVANGTYRPDAATTAARILLMGV